LFVIYQQALSYQPEDIPKPKRHPSQFNSIYFNI